MDNNLDKKMLLAFHRFSCEHDKFRKTAYFVSHYASYVFFAIYFATGLYLLWNHSKLIILFVSVPLANLILSYTIRNLVKRDRPYVAMKLQTPYEQKKSYSFPSNHTTSSTIIAFACLAVNYYVGIAVFMLAVVTGLSRLFLASHYPSDVGFGFAQSAVVAIIGFNIVPRFFL